MKYWRTVSPRGIVNQKIHVQISPPGPSKVLGQGVTDCGMGISPRDVEVEQVPANADFCKKCTKSGIAVAIGSAIFSLHPESGSVLYLSTVP